MEKSKRTIKIIYNVFLHIFALVGFVFLAVLFAMQFGWLNVKGSASSRNKYFNLNPASASLPFLNNSNTNQDKAWQKSEEWQLMKYVFTRDQDVIKRAASDAGVSPRILLGGVMGEQFRFSCKVALHIFVIIEMILCQVSKTDH